MLEDLDGKETYMSENKPINYKEIIKQEYIKCATDPAYFMRKFCYIQHPQRGRILFNLYPFQGKVLQLFRDNPYNIVLKSRQLGISTLSAGYSLWLMLFHKDKNILCIATKTETAKNMVTKVKFMYDNLPSWLREKDNPLENNKLSLRLNNGSQIKAVSAAGDSGRSEAVSLLLIDEAAFIEGVDEIWASAQQTLATGGGAIVLSTPYGTGNWFHRTWVEAESGENDFLPIKLDWKVHPERDQTWRDSQDKKLGDPRLAAQECDCNFSTSGDLVFHPEYLEYIEKNTIEEPIERRGNDRNLWIWKTVDYNKNYVVTADVARGDGKDSSAAQVFDPETNEQVAEYKGQLGPKDFGHFLVGLATEYNNALLAVENANMGWSTVETILERGYSNFYYSSKSGNTEVSSYTNGYEDTSKMTPGFTMSHTTRPLVISKFQEYVFEKSIIIRSKRLLGEMKVFVWKNNRAEAQSGYNDDLIMSCGIGTYIRDKALRYKQQGIEMTKSVLNNITSTKPQIAGYNSYVTANPYTMNVRGRQEDFRWIL